MTEAFSRTEKLIGTEKLKQLENSSVLVFGIGGVGSYAVEALARSGIGHIGLVDNDRVSISNINRQLIATVDTIDRLKVSVARERILSVNPHCSVDIYPIFYSKETDSEIPIQNYDYVIDAIDSVSSKVHLITSVGAADIQIISAMGAGNKLDPARFYVTTLDKTHTCPLARVIRKELKTLRYDIKGLKVVFSDEKPVQIQSDGVPGSVAWVPSVAGLMLAGEVIRYLANKISDH